MNYFVLGCRYMGMLPDRHSSIIMTYQEFTNTIQDRISKLTQKGRLELAIKICKELFFDYQKFYEVHNWGNPDLLLDGINLSEKNIKWQTELFKNKRIDVRN